MLQLASLSTTELNREGGDIWKLYAKFVADYGVDDDIDKWCYTYKPLYYRLINKKRS
jgi:hypothetical protein